MANRCDLNFGNNVSLDINQESDVSMKPLIYREKQKNCIRHPVNMTNWCVGKLSVFNTVLL